MEWASIKLPELVYSFTFILYLTGSSLTHIENGAELSLWLMFFAVVITMSTTIFPWLGIRMFRLISKRGSPSGYRAAIILQVTSWLSFAYAMSLRLGRNMPPFHWMILLTTLLWAVWMLIFLFTRGVRKQR